MRKINICPAHGNPWSAQPGPGQVPLRRTDRKCGRSKKLGPACRVMPGMTAQSFGILLRAFSTAIMHWGWFLKWFRITYRSNEHDPSMAIQTKKSQYKSSNSSRFNNAKVSSFILPILAWPLWIFPSHLNGTHSALRAHWSIETYKQGNSLTAPTVSSKIKKCHGANQSCCSMKSFI